MNIVLRRGKDSGEATAGHLECAKALGLLTVCLRADMSISESAIVVWQNSRGEISDLLERAIRKSALGASKTLTEIIEEEVKKLPKRCEWASQPLIDLLRTEIESDEEQKHLQIERAHESALRVCRQVIREDASSLRVPFSTIFAMGIVLPIIIATILPLWGMVAIGDSWSIDDIREQESGEYCLGAFSGIALAGWLAILIFPVFCIFAAYRLIKNRELISNDFTGASARRLMKAYMMMSVFALSTVWLTTGVVSFCLVAGLMIALILLARKLLPVRYYSESTDELVFSPSVLDAICGRLSYGEHLVRAVLLSIKSNRSSMKLLGNALIKSRSNENAEPLELLETAASKDPRTAAKVLRQFSAHLSELQGIVREMRSELRPIAQSAMVATLALSPFVLGIVAGFNSIGYSSEANDFRMKAIFGVFVMEMALTGYWLTAVLSPDGKGIPKRLFDPCAAMLLSAAIFVSSIGISAFIFA